jgi:formylglycine-generating enzyme
MARRQMSADFLPPMVAIPGGVFVMGSDHHYPEEAPAHPVKVDGFLMDATPVTNDQFAAFVADTHYVTTAELPPDPRDYPNASPQMLRPGSAVFIEPRSPVDRNDWTRWWSFVFDANWRRPYGPGTHLKGLGDHPVVHVTWADAVAYARWAAKELPTEAEWERAARGGLEGATYAWGEEFMPGGRQMANTWQGQFPRENLLEDGYARTSPVGAFPPNPFGLYDMIGNVWEWTADWYADRHTVDTAKPCCVRSIAQKSFDPCDPSTRIPRKVLKGGSHLCAPNYCQRYRPAARHPQPVDTSTSHVGFRCVRRPK